MKYSKCLPFATAIMLLTASALEGQTYTFSILAGQAKKAGHADGTLTNALFNKPNGLALDASGNLYVADNGNKSIRVIQTDGAVTTLSNLSYSFGSKLLNFSFTGPRGIALDANSNIYVSDDNQVYKISSATNGSIVTNLAGSACGWRDGRGSKAEFNGAYGLTVDVQGNVWVADQYNSSVRMIAPDGTVTTEFIRGWCNLLHWPTNHVPALPPDLMNFTGIALDSSNRVFLMDEENYIDVLTASNAISFYYAGFHDCSTGIAFDSSDNLYFFDGNSNQVVSINPSGTVQALGALPIKAGDIEGVAIDKFKNIYLADRVNNVIYKGTPSFPPFFDGQVALSDGVYWLAFPDGTPFGYYNLGSFDFPLFYHYDMGFEYFFDAQDQQSGGYLYDFSSQTFWYTSPSIFPYMYDFTLQAWLYYYPDTTNPGHYTTNPRYFYDFGNKQIITK